MGIYSLTNVPTRASDLLIEGIVEGENVAIVCRKRHAAPDDFLRMTATHVGEHMLSRPADLRRMYADDLAAAIRLGRDAGYAQAKAEIRAALGIDKGSQF